MGDEDSTQIKCEACKEVPISDKSQIQGEGQKELDKMLDVGIILSLEESKWISPMVVQYKKTGGIHIYVDLRNLNDVWIHNPFPTPFTDEVLENVGGKEAYSFIDGLSRYHQEVKIA